jgi:hypothetical protein
MKRDGTVVGEAEQLPSLHAPTQPQLVRPLEIS